MSIPGSFFTSDNKRPWSIRSGILLLVGLALVMSGCVSTPPYVYHYIPGRTATLESGYAMAPKLAPFFVLEAIDAGNRLLGKPYRYGGGHQTFYDEAYDCSGAVSYVLHSIGRMNTPTPSKNSAVMAKEAPEDGSRFMRAPGIRFWS